MATYKAMLKSELTYAVGVSLSTFSAWLRNDQDIMRSINLSKRAQQVTQRMKNYSNTTYLEVLTAQNNLLQAQFARIANQMDLLTSTVALYHALGGGGE